MKTRCLISMLLLMLVIVPAYSADLDGGVSSGDEPISDELQVPTNIDFIKAKVKAKINNGNAETNASGGGVGNITSTCTMNCTIVNSSNNKGVTNVSSTPSR
jgi:hypothetical protein